MTGLQIAQQIPFHQQNCPGCAFYIAEINRCRGFLTDSVPRPILAVFKGESDDPCPKYKSAPQVVKAEVQPPQAPVQEAVPVQSSPVEAVSNSPDGSPPEVSETKIPTTPFIICSRCKAQNPPERLRCSQCRADLLPGEGFLIRLGYLIGGIIVAALFIWLAVALFKNPQNIPEICPSPVALVVAALASFIGALAMALRRTPQYLRYANRSDRHLTLNLPQALLDMNRAIELAPQKERADLLKKRAAIYEKLGDQKEAVRDQLAFTQEPGAYSFGANVSSLLFNADDDSYRASAATSERKGMMDAGTVKAAGFCKKCQQAVELTPKLRCPEHDRARIHSIQYGISDEIEKTKLAVYDEIEQHKRLRNRRLVLLSVSAVLIVAGCCFVNWMLTSDFNPGQFFGGLFNQKPTEAVAVTVPDRTEQAAPQPATQESTSPLVFYEEGFAFEYPGEWQVIGPQEVNDLLKGTLKGLTDYEYIGGVYTYGAEVCPDCAHFIIVVSQASQNFPEWTPELYENTRSEAQQSMGSRLLLHQPIELEGMHGVETVYLGKSGLTKQWDWMLIEPGGKTLYLISGSAHKDYFADFEPIFARAFETLDLPGGEQLETADEPTETPVSDQAVMAAVIPNSAKLRAGPGTNTNTIGGLRRGDEVLVLGRNQAGDWLHVQTKEGELGWVFAELLDCPVPVESLPVEESAP